MTRDSAHIGQQRILVGIVEITDWNDCQGEYSDGWIEYPDGNPHIPQRLGKDTFGLFFDEVGGTLKAGDAQQRSGEPEEDRQRPTKLRLRRHVGGKHVQP